MLEQNENKTIDPRDYWKEFPEAPFSDSFKWVDQNGFEHLSTVRGWTFPAMLTSIERATSAIIDLQGKPANSRAPIFTPAPQEPTRQPIDDGGNELPDVKTATAGRLSWEVHDGKSSYKVMDAVFAAGERGTKYGITVWPEVLKAAGLNIEMGQPIPNISGWRVDYVLNDKGYPQKVTRLLPPK